MRFLTKLAFIPFLTIAYPLMADVSVNSSDYKGSRSTAKGGGLVGTEQWADGGAVLNWDISIGGKGDPAGFHYVYSFNVGAKDISHAIIEVSDNFKLEDLAKVTYNGKYELGTFGKEQGNSNPGIPGNIYGIKFSASSKNIVIDFWTNRAPVWGDFYSKDGKNGGNDVYAYNTGFGTEPSKDYIGNIARPDTSTVPVPEPICTVLFGALGAAGIAMRRKKLA